MRRLTTVLGRTPNWCIHLLGLAIFASCIYIAVEMQNDVIWFSLIFSLACFMLYFFGYEPNDVSAADIMLSPSWTERRMLKNTAVAWIWATILTPMVIASFIWAGNGTIVVNGQISNRSYVLAAPFVNKIETIDTNCTNRLTARAVTKDGVPVIVVVSYSVDTQLEPATYRHWSSSSQDVKTAMESDALTTSLGIIKRSVSYLTLKQLCVGAIVDPQSSGISQPFSGRIRISDPQVVGHV